MRDQPSEIEEEMVSEREGGSRGSRANRVGERLRAWVRLGEWEGERVGGGSSMKQNGCRPV